MPEDKLRTLVSEYGSSGFKVGIGAEAIRDLLRKIDINALWDELQVKARASTSAAMKRSTRSGLRYLKPLESLAINQSG